MGDKVLSTLANFIKKHLRKNDFVARWGGEEFAILLPDTGLDEVYGISKKLNHDISAIDFDNNLFITCSFGVAVYKNNETKDEFFNRADAALYRAKELGRNRAEIAQ